MRGIAGLGLLALLGAAPGCAGRAFSCSDDADCGGEGRCEVAGWCSFPDAQCPTGRRYAEFSGDGLGGSCVESMSQASTSGGPSGSGEDPSGMTGGSSSGAAATSGTSSSTESGGSAAGTDSDASSTCSGGACGTTASSGSTGARGSSDSSTGDTEGPMPPCPGFYDDFGDGAFDPGWVPYGATGTGGHVMTEAGGELRWDFVPNLVEQRGLRRSADAPVSAIVVHVTETTALEGSQAQTVLLFRELGGPPDLLLVWSSDTLQVRSDGDPIADSSTFEWVEVRFEADQVLVFTSADGVAFDLLTSLDVEYSGADLQSVWLYGQTWTQAPAAATAAFGSIRICEP